MKLRSIAIRRCIGALMLLTALLCYGGQKKLSQSDKALLEAAEKGDLKKVQQLLEKGADLNATNDYGLMPLHQAAYGGHTEVVDLLIAKGADLKAKTKDGSTPLRVAADYGRKEVVELLIAKGADVDAKDKYGYTSLYMVANKGQREMAELLIAKGADVNARDNHGRTPLFETPNKEVAELLIAKGADVNTTNNYGLTPLSEAARWGHKEVAELLIAKGADVNAKDKYGMTPLRRASLFSQKEVVELLIAKGADVNAADKDGATSLPKTTPTDFKDEAAPKTAGGYAYLAVAKDTGARLKGSSLAAPSSTLTYGQKEIKGGWPNIVESPFGKVIDAMHMRYYDNFILSSGFQILGVEYEIREGSEWWNERVTQSVSMLKVPLMVEDGHIYVLAAGVIDRSAWAPVVVDLVREGLLSSLAIGLKDPDPLERIKSTIAAATALRAGLSSLLAAPVLTLPLSEMLYEPRGLPFASQALKELGPLAMPILLERLNTGDPTLRSPAVFALGELGAEAKDALPSLMKALEDKTLRDITATALDNIVVAINRDVLLSVDVLGEAGLAAFIECLKDPSDDWMREFAVKTLGDLGPRAKAAVPALAEAQKSDRSKSVRNAAEKALKKIQRSSQIPCN